VGAVNHPDPYLFDVENESWEVHPIEDMPAKNAAVRMEKAIIHEGEVNVIEPLGKDDNIVATHTDAPDVNLFNIRNQRSRKVQSHRGATPNVPDLTLSGHEETGENNFWGLNWSAGETPLLASCGDDLQVRSFF